MTEPTPEMIDAAAEVFYGDGEYDDSGQLVTAMLRAALAVDPLRQADTERALDEVLAERDALEERLDRLAYAVAPQSVIGEHSSANDPWQNALDILIARQADAVILQSTRCLYDEPHEPHLFGVNPDEAYELHCPGINGGA